MNRNIQVLPIIASIGIGAAAYSMMTGRGGKLQNMIPQLSGLTSMASKNQGSAGTNNQ